MRALAATRENDNALRRYLLMGFVFLAAVVATATVTAQRPKSAKKPKLKTITLKTKDGVNLRAFYFPSEEGKEAVTVMLVHEWKGQGSPYGKLVAALHQAGFAVIVPDYRGHGGSKEYKTPGGSGDFDITRMSKRDVENIIKLDLEKAKAFLKEENDKGALNLNALVVIGVREGCVMAGRWAQRDWKFPSVGRMKQGQDVKALIYISPEKQLKGIGIDDTLTDPNLVRLPMMVIAGGTSPDASEARRIAKRVEAMKKRIGRGTATGFQLKLLNTSLSGPAFVNGVDSVIPAIVKFIQTEVKVSDEENPWVARE
jgi:alpha-beta hydrolase superfamily lysophospholipase